ncbi:MAG: hypothetical protein VX527_10890 [Planctomycetota bacterium]|nr:hypothetical protein [Planctomycetota bacterium]
MNRSKPISIPELVELASLDAFGLLDAEDALDFEDAFLAVPDRVRVSIRHLQAELVSDERLIGSEEPDESLRALVLERVSQAMADKDSTLQPLAQIGPGMMTTSSPHDTIARNAFSQSLWTWRAVALVLLGVSITLAVFGIVADRNHRELIQAINSRQAQFVLNQAPGMSGQIAWPTDNGDYLVASLVDPSTNKGRIRLFTNPDGTNPRIAYDLDRQIQSLTIYAIDENGEFGPAGGEFVIAHLDPKQTSAEVVEGFNPHWLGKTRLVARDDSGRELFIQI